jgi:hypothetical protein
MVPAPGGDITLTGAFALAGNDAWAVGFYHDPTYTERTLTLHWDGIRWSVIPSPNIAGAFNNLFGVTALTPQNIWAVGRAITQNGDYQTLILHWDGALRGGRPRRERRLDCGHLRR